MSEDTNYNEIGDEMFQTYFDTYDNTEDHETAQENANGILGDLWYEELEPNNLSNILQEFDISESNSTKINDFLKPMFIYDIDNRSSANNLLESPWLNI